MKLLSRICILAIAFVAVFPFATYAATLLDDIPDIVKSQNTFNGQVNAIVSDGSTLYVGGSFTTSSYAPPYGDPLSTEDTRNNLAAFNINTGRLLSSFNPPVIRGYYGSSTNALALSADGGTLFVGGYFTCIGVVDEFGVCTGDERNNLAAFATTTGALIAGFNPNVGNFDGYVNSLAISSDEILYVGGGFQCVGGVVDSACIDATRNSLASFDVSAGGDTLLPFDPNLDGTVNAIVLSSDESTIYATGGFSTVNGDIPQQYLGAFNSTTGSTTPTFKASLNGEGSELAISSDDSTLYVGGGFSSFVTQSGEGVPFNETTQMPLSAYPKIWTEPQGQGQTVYASIPDGSGGWYIGGSFTHVGTTSQARLAHITAGGLLDGAFNPAIDDGGDGDYVSALALSLDGNTLYAGGSFVGLHGYTVPRDHIAAFATATGVETSFDPGANNYVYDLELSADGKTLYIGGNFTTLGGSGRRGVGAYDVTTEAGSLLPFDAGLASGGGDGTAYALELDSNDTLYVGGVYDAVKYFLPAEEVRNNIAAFSTSTNSVTAFDPNPDNLVGALQLSGDESTLYVGGGFTTIGGASRNAFAALYTTGVDSGTATPLDASPEVGLKINDVQTIAISSDEQTIYIGGLFQGVVDPASEYYFMEIDASTGIETDFSPNFNVVEGSHGVRTISVSTTTSEMYIGGSFTTFGSTSAPYLLGINVSDSSLKTAFDPSVSGSIYSLALTSDDALLYAGGFSQDPDSGLTIQPFLSAFNTSNGVTRDFAPAGINNIYGIALKPDDSELYVGNYDQDVSLNTNLLFFNLSDSDPVITRLGVSPVNLTVGDSYTDAGATALDDIDGDITASIVVNGLPVDTNTPGTYTVRYNVSDSAFNSAIQVTRTVNVNEPGGPDVTAPVITLLGSTPVELIVGDTYSDAGATAEDETDGDITLDIVTVNPVNTAVAGTYVVTYNVEDVAGNPAEEVTRTVNVIVDLNVDEDDDDGGGGGGGTSRTTRHDISISRDLRFLMEQLVGLLEQYLSLLLAAKGQ